MRVHIVKQGEWLSRIAESYGYTDWRPLYDHPANAEFRRRRPNPNLIEPGDRIVIPEPRIARHFIETGRAHRFRLRTQRMMLRLRLCNADGDPIADASYELRFGGRVEHGTTDAEGTVEHEIPRGVEEAELDVPELGRGWLLRIGSLDPLRPDDDRRASIAAAQARLRNLGYDCGPIDGIAGKRTRAATRAFQADVLTRGSADGRLDVETRRRLVAEHGC